MFNFKEIRAINAAMELGPGDLSTRSAISKKMHNMVSTKSFQAFAPCVRQKNDKVLDDVDASERMVVFETEREIVKLLEDLASKKQNLAGHWFVVVAVPGEGFAERLAGLILSSLSAWEISYPQKFWPFQTEFTLKNGLHVKVVGSDHAMMGQTVDWVFFYNELCGF